MQERKIKRKEERLVYVELTVLPLVKDLKPNERNHLGKALRFCHPNENPKRALPPLKLIPRNWDWNDFMRNPKVS